MLITKCLPFVMIALSVAFDEPMCSKFHYEEQLLTKVIKMEIEMNKLKSDMEKSIKPSIESNHNEMENMKSAMETSIKPSIENNRKEMENLKLDIETSIKPSIQTLNNSAAMKPVPMIAFSAYEPAQIEYGDGPIIVFKSVLLNEGSSYDTSTGIFTAKVNGLYHFTVHVCNKIGAYAVVAIAHAGKRIAISTYYENTGSGCGSVSSLIKVGVGEQVNVISAYSNTKMLEDQYRRASFMGVLVNV